MRLPKVIVSWDERVKAIILFWVGVDNATVRGIRAVVGKVRARGNGRRFLGSSQRATPLDAQAIITETSPFH